MGPFAHSSPSLLPSVPPSPPLPLPPPQGSKLPRLQDLHALLLSTSTSSPTATKEENKRLILASVDLFLHKNVEFSEQSAALFLRSMLRVDGLGDAVDFLLEKKKRIGMWAQRKTLHIALHKCVCERGRVGWEGEGGCGGGEVVNRGS